jgi:hypothetical protein
MQTLQPASNSKTQQYFQQAKKSSDTKTLEHYSKIDQHLSQSLSLSPKIDIKKQTQLDYLRHSSDHAALYYEEK